MVDSRLADIGIGLAVERCASFLAGKRMGCGKGGRIGRVGLWLRQSSRGYEIREMCFAGRSPPYLLVSTYLHFNVFL